MPPHSPAPPSRRKLYLATAVVVVLLLVAAVAILHYDKKKVAAVTAKSPAAGTGAVVTPTSGSDNASLNTDLNTVGSGLTKENQDQSAATGAINDQQQEITVPTN
jgi:hypothetical protein